LVRLVDGRPTEALAEFDEVGFLGGLSSAYDYNRGLAELWVGELDRALGDLHRAAKAADGPSPALLGVAAASLLLGRVSDARAGLAEAARRIPPLPRLASLASVIDGVTGGSRLTDYPALVARQMSVARKGHHPLVLTFLTDPPVLCGGQLIYYEWVNGMAARGHEVTVLSHGQAPPWKEVKAPFRTLPLSQRLSDAIPPGDASFGIYWDQIADLVAGNPRSTPFYVFQGDPYIFERGHERLSAELSPHVAKVVDHLYGQPCRLIVISDLLHDLLKKHYDRESVVVENAIEPSHFFPRPKTSVPGRPRIVFMGPEAEFKGTKEIKVALDLLRQRGVTFEAIHICPNPSADPSFTGLFIEAPPPEEIGRIVAEADLLVSASHYESFAMPPLEAMACGTTVVTAANDGVRQYAVDGSNCLMFPPGNIEAMAAAIESAIKDQGLRDRLVQAGQAAAARFRWPKSLSKLEDIVWDQTVALQPDLRPLAKTVAEAEARRAGARSQTVSVCMIVRNEASHLGRCLAGIEEVADELVVADTGSADHSALIAILFGGKVGPFPWGDDFSAARNWVLDQANGDWILCLDADEELHPESILPLLALARSDTSADAFYLTAENLCGSDDRQPGDDSRVLRLFRNNGAYRFEGRIHEQVLPSIIRAGGRVEASSIRLRHYGYLGAETAAKDKPRRNIRLLEECLQEQPEDLYLRFQLAREQLRTGDDEAAVDTYDRVVRGLLKRKAAVTSEDFVPVAVLGATQIHLRTGRAARAKEIADQFSPLWPDYAELNLTRGQALRSLGHHREAARAFLGCIAGGPSPAGRYSLTWGLGVVVEAWRELGLTYEESGHPAEALAAYQQALAVSPGHPETLQYLSSLILRSEHPQKAFPHLVGLVSGADDRLALGPATVVAKASIKERFPQFAEELLTKALGPLVKAGTASPDQEIPLYWLAIALEAQNRYDESGAIFARLADCPDVGREARWHWALRSVLVGRPVETADCLGPLTERAPAEAGLYLELARVMAAGAGPGSGGRAATTETVPQPLTGARKAFMSLAEHLWDLGEAGAFEGLISLAGRVFENAGKAARELGKLYYRRGAEDEALACLVRAAENGASDGDSLACLGKLAWRRGLPEDAVEFLRRSIWADAGRFQAWLDLVRVLVDLDRRGEALKVVQAALAGPFRGHAVFLALEQELAAGAA
jgi:glycosyltransferase involved in cell wall biosynthesis/tetratricopeptide (TPR) repeat protein